MGMRCACCLAAAASALLGAATATAGRLVSVGYTTPSALHGLHVVERGPALRIAQVRAVPACAHARASASSAAPSVA